MNSLLLDVMIPSWPTSATVAWNWLPVGRGHGLGFGRSLVLFASCCPGLKDAIAPRWATQIQEKLHAHA